MRECVRVGVRVCVCACVPVFTSHRHDGRTKPWRPGLPEEVVGGLGAWGAASAPCTAPARLHVFCCGCSSLVPAAPAAPTLGVASPSAGLELTARCPSPGDPLYMELCLEVPELGTPFKILTF